METAWRIQKVGGSRGRERKADWRRKEVSGFSLGNSPSVSGNFPGLEQSSSSRTLGPQTNLHPTP